MRRRSAPEGGGSAHEGPSDDRPPAQLLGRPGPAPLPAPVAGVVAPSHSPSFEVLREQLAACGNGRAVQTIVFTGCGYTEPAGMFVQAFARNLASLGSRVLVIDGDASGDASRADLAAAVRSVAGVATEAAGQGRLARLTMSLAQGEKETFLRSAVFAAWLDAQRAVFDYVLFAAPPVARFADAMLLGRVTDGVVLLVHAESTERSALTRARAQLDRAGVVILGAVLDGVRHELPPTLRRYLGDG